MRQITTNPFSVSVGSVQEVDGYFSTSGVECAVVIEELRGHGLVYEFLNYPIAAFSFSLPLRRSSLIHQLTVHQHLRNQRRSYHGERGSI